MQSRKPKATRGFVRATVDELLYNAARCKNEIVFDAFVLLICICLFYLNDRFLIGFVNKMSPGSFSSYIMRCHVIDAIGGCAFLAYANLLLDLVKPEARFKKMRSVLVLILFCGLFWECVAPLFVPGSIGDPIDVVAYIFGALIYFALSKWVFRSMKGSASVNEREGT